MNERLDASHAAGSDSKESPPCILCVDDDEDDFLVLQQHLEQMPVEPRPVISRAASLAAALLHLNGENRRFDTVLLHLPLPDCKDPEALTRLAEAAPRTAITVLGGESDRAVVESMPDDGTLEFISRDGLEPDRLTRSVLQEIRFRRWRDDQDSMKSQFRRATRELKAVQLQLIQAEKLHSLGRLAAGVAHDVKNHLSTLQMGVDFFAQRSDDLDESSTIIINQMQESISRAEKIIRGMVDYSRAQTLNREPQDINQVVRKALELIQHEMQKMNIMVELGLAEQVPSVLIDRGKMEQVLINLILNAGQAMAPTGGNIHVRTLSTTLRELPLGGELPELDVSDPWTKVVVVEVRDEGPGIPDQALKQIFEPFFTTKPEGEGTGLGLSVSRNIIDLHKGAIRVRNVDDPSGLEVCIFLKALEGPPKTSQESGSS